MKIYKNQSEIDADIKNGVLEIEGDVKFECSFSISASIKVINGKINARDIDAGDINAWKINAANIDAWKINAMDIDAWNINARDINVWNINAGDINAWDINARDINAWNINAGNIDAWNIDAWNIDAVNILYSAFCCVYKNIKCLSIKAKRTPSKEPICLDGELTFKKDEPKETIKIGDKTFDKQEVESALKNVKAINYDKSN